MQTALHLETLPGRAESHWMAFTAPVWVGTLIAPRRAATRSSEWLSDFNGRESVIIGIGLDVVDPQRIARAIEAHGDYFAGRIFTSGEIADCAGRVDESLAFAARFAAKEACLKALGRGLGLPFRDIEVVRAKGEAPTLRLGGGVAERAKAMGVESIWVSLSHENGVAAAVVILEGRGADSADAIQPTRE